VAVSVIGGSFGEKVSLKICPDATKNPQATCPLGGGGKMIQGSGEGTLSSKADIVIYQENL